MTLSILALAVALATLAGVLVLASNVNDLERRLEDVERGDE